GLTPGGRAAPCPRLRNRSGVASRASMNSLTMYLIYGLPGLVLLVLHVRRRRRLERQSLKALESTGAAEPASLHPIIDPATCIGCSSCDRPARNRLTSRSLALSSCGQSWYVSGFASVTDLTRLL